MNGRRYDSKAIAGAAHRYAAPAAGPLKRADFSGGEASVGRVLEQLGFTVEGPTQSTAVVPSIDVGRIYSWNELGTAFGFAPSLFQVGGRHALASGAKRAVAGRCGCQGGRTTGIGTKRTSL